MRRSVRKRMDWLSPDQIVEFPAYLNRYTLNYHINNSETIYNESSHFFRLSSIGTVGHLVYNESSQVLIDPRDKLKHKIETFIVVRHFRSWCKLFDDIA